MPELPEVETIARELRPLLDGATIRAYRTDWPRAIKHPDPERFAAEDPYVKGGLVTQWQVRAWNTVVGDAATNPLRPDA